MLINDKSQFKRNREQIGFQLALKTSKSLSWPDRLRQTVPYCRTGNREGSVSKLSSVLLANVNSCSCSLYVVVRPSVVCRLSSVTFVHPTQAIEIFGNVTTPFGTLAICNPSVKILRRSSQGNPSIGGLNQRVLEKCIDFVPFRSCISETVQDRR